MFWIVVWTKRSSRKCFFFFLIDLTVNRSIRKIISRLPDDENTVESTVKARKKEKKLIIV